MLYVTQVRDKRCLKKMAKNAVQSTPDAPKHRRKRMMSDAEVITILICFHFNSYRNFKHYYQTSVCGFWKDPFPKRFSYNRFIEVMPRCFVALTMFLRLSCFLTSSSCHPKNLRQRVLCFFDAYPELALLDSDLEMATKETERVRIAQFNTAFGRVNV